MVFNQVQNQLGSLWNATYSQLSSIGVGTRNTILSLKGSVEYYTTHVAQYVLNKDARTEQRKKLIIENYVVPLSIILGGTTLLVSRKAAGYVSVAALAYTIYIAKKTQKNNTATNEG